jgi:putative RNA 2'-phosphotransferase
MDKSRSIKISKYLSQHLRHKPESIGLKLESGGWVDVENLLTACATHQFPITRVELENVVTESDKQRFSFNETKTRIRANQGHSIEVDLQLQPQIPPNVLYHGTAKQFLSSILESGLQKMSRHHVHLSPDIETAKKVGSRRGSPVILRIDAVAMHTDGIIFYRSDNGVWLVDFVPVEYLQII